MFDRVQQFYSNIPQRWILALMCFLALCNAYTMRICLSIALTEMVVTTTKEEIITHNTCPSLYAEPRVNHSNDVVNSRGTYDWSEHTQGIILSSFYVGYAVTHLPGGMIAEKYGGKHTLGIGILLAAIFTLLTPTAIYIGDSTALIILRIIMGLGEGVTIPAINVLLAQWTPPNERSRIATFVYAGSLMGTIFATSLSGWILRYTNVNWPLVFYVMGAISVIWFVIWLFTGYNNPREHPFISSEEVEYLKNQMNEHIHEKPPPVPWRYVLKSKPLWAVIIALIGFNWALVTLITDLPKYMSSVLKLNVESNGYLSSLVYLCMWISGNASSWLVDHIVARKKMSITCIRKLGSIMALSVSAIFVVAASYAGCDYVLFVVLLIIALTAMGTAFPILFPNSIDLSPNYAGTLMAMINGFSTLTGVISPYIIGVLTPNQTLEEWRLIFWILFFVSVISNVVFLFWGSGEVERWNDPEFIVKEIERRDRKINTARMEVRK